MLQLMKRMSRYASVKKACLSSKVDSFLSGSNSVYVEQMYHAWKTDKSSVHLSWASYFSNLDEGVDPKAVYYFSSPLCFLMQL